MSHALKLRSLLASNETVIAPGIFDGLTGLLAEKAGFNCGYIGGASISYSKLGRSDVGLTTSTEVADTISKISQRESPEIESMEGASVFKVCEEFNVSCIQIRSISNKVEKRNKDNWDLDLAIRNLNIEVEKIIDNL